MSDTNKSVCYCGDPIQRSGNGWSHALMHDNRYDHAASPDPPKTQSTPPEQRASADELLAEVMHLWIDGYISKNPKSRADASISSGVFDKLSAYLTGVGIVVDYCGWHRTARPEAVRMPIDRYSLMSSMEGYTKVATGEWVLYTDHVAVVDAERAAHERTIAELERRIEAYDLAVNNAIDIANEKEAELESLRAELAAVKGEK